MAGDTRFFTKSLKIVGKVAGGVLAVITVLGLLAFMPRTTVSSTMGADQTDSFAVNFLVANTSILSLEDLDVGVGLCKLGPVISPPFGRAPPCKGERSSILRKPQWQHHRLRKDEQFSISLNEMFETGGAAKGLRVVGDITIVITYNLWIMPWHRFSDQYHFVSVVDHSGQVTWQPFPLD